MQRNLKKEVRRECCGTSVNRFCLQKATMGQSSGCQHKSTCLACPVFREALQRLRHQPMRTRVYHCDKFVPGSIHPFLEVMCECSYPRRFHRSDNVREEAGHRLTTQYACVGRRVSRTLVDGQTGSVTAFNGSYVH